MNRLNEQEAVLVLVLHESERVRNSVADYLRSAGFLVITEKSGEQAVQLFEYDQPDLILTSLFFSHFDVIQLIVRVRTQIPSFPFIGLYSSSGKLSKDIERQVQLVRKFGVDTCFDCDHQLESLEAEVARLMVEDGKVLPLDSRPNKDRPILDGEASRK